MRRALMWLLATGPAMSAGAQVTTLDEGSFTIFVNGVRAGYEQFSIQRRPDGGTVTVLAHASIQVGDRRVVPALTADTTGLPVSYKLEERIDGTISRRLEAQAAGTILRLTAITPRGRAERDLRLAPATLVLDEDIAHQYYFLALRSPGASHRVLVPRRLEYDTVTVRFVDAREVEIGNGTLPSRQLTVTTAGGVATDVWVDAAGRVLRVATPSRGFVAIRDEPPR